jgi:coiled-coil and C2 domain-containing protein 2A
MLSNNFVWNFKPQGKRDVGSLKIFSTHVASTLLEFINDYVLFFQQVLRLLSGDSEDHAVLLCCFLMHLGKKAWLLLGVGIPHGPTAYVLTREEEQHNLSSYWLWDPASGQKYSIQDSFCPLQKVFCLINDENVSVCYCYY